MSSTAPDGDGLCFFVDPANAGSTFQPSSLHIYPRKPKTVAKCSSLFLLVLTTPVVIFIWSSLVTSSPLVLLSIHFSGYPHTVLDIGRRPPPPRTQEGKRPPQATVGSLTVKIRASRLDESDGPLELLEESLKSRSTRIEQTLYDWLDVRQEARIVRRSSHFSPVYCNVIPE